MHELNNSWGGRLDSVEWNGGMEWWNDTVEWNSGMTTPTERLLPDVLYPILSDNGLVRLRLLWREWVGPLTNCDKPKKRQIKKLISIINIDSPRHIQKMYRLKKRSKIHLSNFGGRHTWRSVLCILTERDIKGSGIKAYRKLSMYIRTLPPWLFLSNLNNW